jgi:hypothetical protein
MTGSWTWSFFYAPALFLLQLKVAEVNSEMLFTKSFQISFHTLCIRNDKSLEKLIYICCGLSLPVKHFSSKTLI